MKEKMTPANLSREQISHLAALFAKKTSFTIGMDIFEYVRKNLKGQIKYSDNKADSSGGSIEVKKDSPFAFTIYLSQVTSIKRDVFTIAHELGHYVLHSRLGQIPLSANRSGENDEAEKEANTFAACFLMPEEEVKEKFFECGNTEELAKEFNVSHTAMHWRCHNLKLVD